MRDDVLRKVHEDPAGTAARILDAAEEVFAEAGYAATSTREVARRAGVPFGALHYHWGSKRELWEGVFTRLAERIGDTLARNLVPGRTAGETLDHLVDAFFDTLLGNPTAARLAYRMALEPRERHPASVRAMFRALSAEGERIFRDLTPGSTLDVAAAIHVITSAFEGAIANVDGQEDLLGGSIFTSREPRERLRRELRRVARAVFDVQP